MKKIKTSVIMIALYILFCAVTANAGDWHSTGWTQMRVYPLNQEHGEYAETRLHADIGYKKITLYVEPNLVCTNSLAKDNPRTDNRKYLTSYAIGKFAYFSEFPVGLSYQINKSVSAGLIYLPRRDPYGYRGDSFGFEVKIALW